MAGRLNLSRLQAGGASRRPMFLALIGVVVVVHLLVTRVLADRLADFRLAQDRPARIEVLYVRDMPLEQSVQQAAAAPPTPRTERSPRAVVARPAEAASAPRRTEASQPATRPAEPLPTIVETVIGAAAPLPAVSPTFALDPPPLPAEPPVVLAEPAQLPASAIATGPATAIAPAAAADVAPFEWPVSTKVSYAVTGNVRGEVHGDAQVEWIRSGANYQVHLDVTLGLHVAPLMTRRMSSEGLITADGLSPRRYDQETKIGFGDRRRAVVHFGPSSVMLANGALRARPHGVQDTASQFIQLTYLFSTRSERLRVGDAIEVPLALPRNVSQWTYDVLGEEPVYTPFGAVSAFHLKPRRRSDWGGDLSAEIWFAPQLRYLPVRIRIHQDAETFIDLILDRKPQLAAN